MYLFVFTYQGFFFSCYIPHFANFKASRNRNNHANQSKPAIITVIRVTNYQTVTLFFIILGLHNFLVFKIFVNKQFAMMIKMLNSSIKYDQDN